MAAKLLLILTLTLQLIELDAQYGVNEGDSAYANTECYGNIYQICDGKRWSQATADEYDACVRSHNGYLNNYPTM